MDLKDRFGIGKRRSDGVQIFTRIDPSILKYGEAVESRFVAIEVAVKMLQEPQRRGWLYVEPDENFDIEFPIYDGVFIHTTTGSFLLWRRKVDEDFVYFVFKYSGDFVVTYPIDKITLHMQKPRSKSVAVIHNEQELVGELDKILHSM